MFGSTSGGLLEDSSRERIGDLLATSIVAVVVTSRVDSRKRSQTSKANTFLDCIVGLIMNLVVVGQVAAETLRGVK